MRAAAQGAFCAWLTLAMLAPAAAGVDQPVAAASPQASPLVEQSLLLGFLADNSTLTLIDARSPEEYATRQITGAVNIPHDRLEEFADRLPADTAEPIVVYCKSGMRAGLLQAQLAARGYGNVQVLPPRQMFWTDEVMVFNCGVTDETKASPASVTATTVGAAAPGAGETGSANSR